MGCNNFSLESLLVTFLIRIVQNTEMLETNKLPKPVLP